MLSSLRLTLVRHGKGNPTPIVTEGNPLTLGVYAAAVTAGYMSDTVHPSETGNNLRGTAYSAAIL